MLLDAPDASRTLTLKATAEVLNAEGHTTATGLPWSTNVMAKVQQRLIANL